MPPTRAEIAAGLGFSTASSAEDHLRALARKGALEITPGASRGLRLTEMPELPGNMVGLRRWPNEQVARLQIGEVTVHEVTVILSAAKDLVRKCGRIAILRCAQDDGCFADR